MSAVQPQPTAFERFYHGAGRPCDAMDLAIADAIHAKLGTASALIAYRDNREELRQAVENLMRFAEAAASANQVTGWESGAQAAVNHAKRALFSATA